MGISTELGNRLPIIAIICPKFTHRECVLRLTFMWYVLLGEPGPKVYWRELR